MMTVSPAIFASQMIFSRVASLCATKTCGWHIMMARDDRPGPWPKKAARDLPLTAGGVFEDRRMKNGGSIRPCEALAKVWVERNGSSPVLDWGSILSASTSLSVSNPLSAKSEQRVSCLQSGVYPLDFYGFSGFVSRKLRCRFRTGLLPIVPIPPKNCRISLSILCDFGLRPKFSLPRPK